MSKNISFITSSELMVNYRLAEILDQQQEFQVAQTSEGTTLFFGIGTDKEFYLIKETSGDTNTPTGWAKTVLNKNLKGKAKSFSISQNRKDGNIDIALVMEESPGQDKLYIRFDCSHSDLSWVSNEFRWKEVFDDRKKGKGTNMNIISTFLSDTKAAENFLVVDLADGSGHTDRYIIDVDHDQKWIAHPLVADLTTDNAKLIDDVMGMPKGHDVVGLYTFGAVNHLVQCFFEPMYDEYADVGDRAPSDYFNLDDLNLRPDNAAFAGCPSASDPTSTDIFFAGGGKLFYLAADKQVHGAKPTEILTHDLFTNVKQLYANSSKGKLVVWGRNHEDKIFYTACSADKVYTQNAWSVPLPLFSEVAVISTCLDLKNNAITLFANHGRGKLFKGTQDDVHGTWKFENIELPAPDSAATSGHSFSSSIKVVDSNNLPIANAEVTLQSESYTSLYINDVFYRLGKDPITVKADYSGVVHIIEWVDGVTATSIDGHVEGAEGQFRIDPAAVALERILSLNTPEKLEEASIQHKDGTSRKLLPTDQVPPEKRELLAHSIGNLAHVYHGITGTITLDDIEDVGDSVIDYVAVLAGDALRYVTNSADPVIHFIRDAAKDVFHFILEVGNQVYGFVMDTIEKVAHGLEIIWKAVVGAIGDLIDFLKFLFNIEDFVLAKNVIKQVVKLNIRRIGEALQDLKHGFDENVVETEQLIQNWAEGPAENWPLPDKFNNALGGILVDIKNNELVHKVVDSAPARMLMNHFKGNIKRSTIHFPEVDRDKEPTWDTLLSLDGFLETQSQVMTNLIHDLIELFKTAENPGDPSFKQVLMRIVGDVAIGGLEIAKLTVDKVLDFVTLLIWEIPKILDAPIEIPLLSDVLKEEFDFEMPSVLDIMVMILAVPATLMYKTISGEAPFERGKDGSVTTTDRILSANTFKEMKQVLDESGAQNKINMAMYEVGCFFSGYATLCNGIFKILDEETQGGSGTVLELPQSISSTLATFSNTVAKTFATPVSIKNGIVSTYNTVMTDLNTIRTLAFAAAPGVLKKVKKFPTDKAAKAGMTTLKKVDSGIESAFAIALMIPPAWQVFEAISDPEVERTTLSLMDSTQSILAKISTCVGFAALWDSEYLSKQVIIGIQGILVIITGGIKMEQGLVHRLFIEMEK